MRRPTNGDAAFRTAKPVRNLPLPSGKHERERTRPMACRKARGITAQSQIQPSYHFAGRHEDQKRLPRRTSLESHEHLDRIVIDRAAEAVHRLGGISEHSPILEVRYRFGNGGLDLRWRPEGNLARPRHSVTRTIASTRAKSVSSVTFTARSLPFTTTISHPICSHSTAQSVANARVRLASRYAASIMSRGNA